MNRKLMAAAVAGALGVAVPGLALAQSSTVQIGGSMNLLYYQHKPHNDNLPIAAQPATESLGNLASASKKGDIMENAEPEIFVAGEEKLGGGLAAWFRCTSSMDITSASGSGLCTRNSAIGFKGSFGNVFFGNWDMPQKLVVNQVRGWFSGTNALYGGVSNLLFAGSASGVANPSQSATGAVTVIAATGITTAQLNTATSSNPGTYYRRQANTANYHSPSWGGFQLQGAYSASNESTGIEAMSPLKPRLISLAAHFTSGPLWVGLGAERHIDYNPANQTQGALATEYRGGEDDNWTLGARFTLANNLKLSGMVSRTEYQVTNSTTTKVSGWGAFADWNVAGPHSIKAAFAKVNDTKGNADQTVASYKGTASLGCGVTSSLSCASDTGAKMYTLAYTYAFSKRTTGGFAYNRMSSDSNSAFSQGKTAVTAGGRQQSFGMLVQHRF